MRAKTRLPLALAVFGLLPQQYAQVRGLVVKTAPPTPRRAGHRRLKPRG